MLALSCVVISAVVLTVFSAPITEHVAVPRDDFGVSKSRDKFEEDCSPG
jgi:hypothetical protein